MEKSNSEKLFQVYFDPIRYPNYGKLKFRQTCFCYLKIISRMVRARGIKFYGLKSDW